MKKLVNTLIIILILMQVFLAGCQSQAQRPAYSVRLAADEETIVEEFDYTDIVVIDAEGFDEESVETLKERGQIVWSYLNVGSIEEFRSFYDEYSCLSLGEYEGWEGEYWIDVSSQQWQEHIMAEASAFRDKGVNGVFLDNFDVYAVFSEEEIYEGLTAIIDGLSALGIDVVVNGGSEFVQRYLSEGGQAIDAVNQESVFSGDADSQEYYLDYLAKCRDFGLETFIIEYTDNEEIVAQIKKYCDETGTIAYVTDDIYLG